MSLLYHTVFNRHDDDFLFTHPFVDRFFEEDEVDLFHAFHRALTHPPRLLLTMAPHNNQKKRSRGRGEKEGGSDGSDPSSREVSSSCEALGGEVSTSEEEATSHHASKKNKVVSPLSTLSPLLGSDLVESESDYKIHVDLPGVEVSDVEISLVENKFVVIQAERKHVHEEEKDKVHSMERSYGKVQRRFRLPANADVEKASSVFKQGVLTVTVPKKVVASGEEKVRKLLISTE